MGVGGFVVGWGQPHTSQTLSSQSLAFKNIRVFKTVMERSLWWIGTHCRVCHLARVTLPSPSSFLFVRIVDDSRVHRGITGSRWSSICCTLWRICPPWPAVFQDHLTAVTVETTATRWCLSHKISKTQVRRALSVFTVLLLNYSSPLPLHTASPPIIHLS